MTEPAPYRYFEDYSAGMQIDLGTQEVSAAEIVEFAQEFDPAPFHLSEEGGRRSMVGRMFASGWHVCSIAMRMMCDSFVLNSASQGAPGVNHVKWLSPVFPGARLTGTATVLSARPSSSRPNLGIVVIRSQFLADGKPALEFESPSMVLRRPQFAGETQ